VDLGLHLYLLVPGVGLPLYLLPVGLLVAFY
jgi:hypothetical protein